MTSAKQGGPEFIMNYFWTLAREGRATAVIQQIFDCECFLNASHCALPVET